MTRKPTTTLISAVIGTLGIVSAVIMAENLMKGFPKGVLPPDRLAMYPIAALVLAIEAAVLLGVAALLIRFGGSVQQGVFSDQSAVVEVLIGANGLVALQAAANVSSVLVQNIAVPYGPTLVFIGALSAICLALLNVRKLYDLSWELRR
ncbi:MAG: hypothetical protein HGB37_04315 [Candidatus Moranbacteria bacterium]|nr:hypothetical protein [Candidatus Moranbacteria bacterium]